VVNSASTLTDGLRGSNPLQATKENIMRRLIYDMYYADEISVEIAERLLDRLEKARNKRRRY
jgi:hypothetical protein